MELIDRVELINIVKLDDYGITWDADAVVKLLESAPAIDAVPVVRCKDCIFCYKYPNPAMYCRRHSIETDSDFYCEDGMEGDEE